MRSRCALVVIAALVAGCGGDPHASLTVRAASRFVDAPVTVTVHTQSAATLHGRWAAADGHAWTSSVPLPAGTTTLRGVDGMRFLWGMRPVGPPYRHPFFAPPLGRDVSLSVSVGGKTVAHATLARRLVPPSVHIRPLTVRRDGLAGLLFTPPVHTRRPAALVFGGSEGHDAMYAAAALLAARGYPALSLAYFDEAGLPSRLVRIPLEYFARAVRLLRAQPHVDPAHVVVMGDSRGGELALLLGSTFPRLIHGAIGLVPSAYVNPSLAANRPAWTLNGRPIRVRRIQVERISGPVLTAGAGDDAVWGSKSGVQLIERRLDAHHFRFRHQGLVYERAGHIIGTAVPYLPAPTDQGAYGGTARPDAAAKADLWPRILRYLARL